MPGPRDGATTFPKINKLSLGPVMETLPSLPPSIRKSVCSVTLTSGGLQGWKENPACRAQKAYCIKAQPCMSAKLDTNPTQGNIACRKNNE